MKEHKLEHITEMRKKKELFNKKNKCKQKTSSINKKFRLMKITYLRKEMKHQKKFCKHTKINYINNVVNNGIVGKLKNTQTINN